MTSRPPRKYNLHELHSNETPLQRYMRLTVGEDKGLWSLFLQELCFLMFAGLPGLPGYGLRKLVYPRIFSSINKHAVLGRQLTLRCPRNIHLAEGVVIDDFVQLIASSSRHDAIVLGKDSFIRSYAQINAGSPEGFVHIGKNSTIGQSTLIYGNGGVNIGNEVMIAGHCSIIASSHIIEDNNVPMIYQGYEARGIEIADNVWIGTGVRILDGVSIGSGVVVGANAVVNRSIPPGVRVAGVPAREIHLSSTDQV